MISNHDAASLASVFSGVELVRAVERQIAAAPQAPSGQQAEPTDLIAAARFALKALDEEAAAYYPDTIAHVDEARAKLRAALAGQQSEPTDEQCDAIAAAVRSVFGGMSGTTDKAEWESKTLKARNLIRAALAGQQAEPIVWALRFPGDGGRLCLSAVLARFGTRPVAEPFGYWCKFQDGSEGFLKHLPAHPDYGDVPTLAMALYAAPTPAEPSQSGALNLALIGLANAASFKGKPLGDVEQAAVERALAAVRSALSNRAAAPTPAAEPIQSGSAGEEDEDIRRARKVLARLCNHGLVSMSIPVDHTRDEDMLLSRIIERAALASPTPAEPAKTEAVQNDIDAIWMYAQLYADEHAASIDPSRTHVAIEGAKRRKTQHEVSLRQAIRELAERSTPPTPEAEPAQQDTKGATS